ncbi:D-glycero-beta-D-manno-heptose 1,7-bisphosphate 7-phosphatase [Geopsychrobacter electrodiphilus]|uniref:D-glycero-beta-D-manno-heptose 1,7-bisphosphate 7-phosphatase n=1 Tax=Geopsychrobacter electrodiphilus TaxID=225196 RepID=UPI0003793530|nr:D-glycero-beta-D-manno-heptose 1,7-bisphosphate 7-phosphatase [Geopsychrobacter electrodiphilus]
MTPHSSLLSPHRNTARRAVFLDRDGTINVEKDYLYRVEDFEFIPGVPLALKKLQDAGFLLVVVTNQSGIARGYYTLEDVDVLHRHMCKELQGFGVEIAGIYICPHHPSVGPPDQQDCLCRKGRPGLLIRAASELDIDLSRSFMVGDKMSDFEAGVNAGCTSCLVASGHRILPQGEANIFADLPAVVEAILLGQATL